MLYSVLVRCSHTPSLLFTLLHEASKGSTWTMFGVVPVVLLGLVVLVVLGLLVLVLVVGLCILCTNCVTGPIRVTRGWGGVV